MGLMIILKKRSKAIVDNLRRKGFYIVADGIMCNPDESYHALLINRTDLNAIVCKYENELHLNILKEVKNKPKYLKGQLNINEREANRNT